LSETSQPAVPSLHHSPTEAAAERTRGAHKGDTIGERYLVEGQIGRGGMGRVLRVRHTALDKAFALKLPKTAISADPALRARFQIEAKVASSLSHENICSVVDFGEDPRFGPFMVMELLEGVRLDYRLRHDGRLVPRVVYDIMMQICEALRFVHSKGIVHGDIKSENILVLRSERRRVVKLLDFGLARLGGGVTNGDIEGTPQYLAPERIHGDSATTASDIYALGILFYELLTGTIPFDGDHATVFQRHLHEPVPKPSLRIDRAIDERADLIVARATSKLPADRHPDVASFLYELRALMSMEGLDGRRRVIDNPTGRRVRRATEAEGPGQLGHEIFMLAPLPLAAVDVHGRVHMANPAFTSFIDASGDEIMLGDTHLIALCHTLIDDLRFAATEGATLNRMLKLRSLDGKVVLAALLMTPAPSQSIVYLAIHPLTRGG
jgi:serine/threonine protein kinase